MRKPILSLIIMIPLVGIGGMALAGDYHQSSDLVCSDCHTMHYSISHGYSSDTYSGAALIGGPHDKLLKQSGSALCLACHDGSSTDPDVFEANTASYTRAAGALNDTASTGTYDDWMGHTLGSSGTPPGGSGSITLTCASCHEPHGNANYRNLQSNPDGAGGDLTVTYTTTGTADYSVDINQGADDPMTTHYAASNISYMINTGDPYESAYGTWCGDCHGNFHSGYTVESPDNYRHPTKAESSTGNYISMGYFNANSSKVPIMANATQGIPGCMSCHKAHGNKNGFGLLYVDRTSAGPVGEEGTSGGAFSDLCRQCHDK